MIDPQIVKALVEVSVFLEFSDERSIDPDAAVTAMEQLAANLQGVDVSLKPVLVSQIRSIAIDYPDHMEFVRDLPESFGLQ